jgi:ribA/ribD-fused uncharacterized protein
MPGNRSGRNKSGPSVKSDSTKMKDTPASPRSPKETSSTESTKQNDTKEVTEAQVEPSEVSIKLLLQKFDAFSTQLKELSSSISEMKDDMKSLKELKTDMGVLREDTNDNTDRIDQLEKDLAAANSNINILATRCDNLHANSVQQDQYSRRDNLLFDNVEEKDDENCSNLTRGILINNLKFSEEEVGKIKFVRCHRLGKPQENRRRTIICRFHYYGERMSVWKRRSSFKGSNIRVSEDFPKEVVARRNSLVPIMFEARNQKLKAYLVADKLTIEENTYTVDDLNKLSDKFDFSKVGTKKVSENITAFYGSSSMLSNFSFARFKSKGRVFHSSEQYLFYHEALLFKDYDTAARILSAKTPGECKSLSRKVANFDFDLWKTSAKGIMKQALTEKFSQNKACYKALEATGTTTIVEASPVDCLWGAGLGINDKDLGNVQTWKGENWMGELLGDVRKELITG